MVRVIIAAAAAAFLVGCVGEKVPVNEDPNRPVIEDDPYEKAQEPRVRESFERMQKAIIDGDTKTYFELLSRQQQATKGSYDAFLREYAQEGNGWREMWRGAAMTQVAVEKDKASTLIRWSTPGPRLIEWVLEDGIWRFHYPVPE